MKKLPETSPLAKKPFSYEKPKQPKISSQDYYDRSKSQWRKKPYISYFEDMFNTESHSLPSMDQQ